MEEKKGGGGGRRTVGCFMFSLCWFALFFFFNFISLLFILIFFNIMPLGIRFSNILCKELFLIYLTVKNQCDS